MMLSLPALFLALQAAPPTGSADSLRVPPDSYVDVDARETVRRARERRDVVDRSITGYRVLAKQRISVGLRALRRDRLAFRQETAARIHWSRDGVGRVEVLGARQVVPIAMPDAQVDDVADDAADLAFDPAHDRLLQGIADEGDDQDLLAHPLSDGSERYYRFQSGDTTRLRLAGGREIRLVELRILPRSRRDALLQGSMWFDMDTHSPVRAAFQLNRPLDLKGDLDDDDDDIPGILQPIVGDLRYFTIDYGLWEQRWWLPRLIAVEVEARAGSMLNVPVLFERSYEEYEVEGQGTRPLSPDPVRPDSQKVRQNCERERCWRYTLDTPPDSALLHSEHLPASIYTPGEALISEQEIRDLADAMGISRRAVSPWMPPSFRWRYLDPGLLRYNRVEGLALGARVDVDAGRFTADATAWLATADLQPSFEIGVNRERFDAGQRLALYRRLAAADPDPRALGPGSSLSALLLGRDDSDYYRSLGAEIRGESKWSRGGDYGWRAYAERQTPAEKGTDFSLPRLFDSGRAFPENITAAEAHQLGGAVTAGLTGGLDPTAGRWGAELTVGAETGTFDFVRPSASAFAGFPLPGGLLGALEVAGGASFGDVPVQGEWFLGGTGTVRGYGGGSRIHGEAFWRSRAEVSTSFPAARLALFSDAGWAGGRDELTARPALLSAGVGASFLDGLLRLDLARALRGTTGWRLDLYLDGML